MKLLDFDGDDPEDGFTNRMLDKVEDHPLYYAVLRSYDVLDEESKYSDWTLNDLRFVLGYAVEDQISIHTRGRIERVDTR